MKKLFAVLYISLAGAGFCAAQTAQAPAGVFRQEGIASWYGTEFDGRPTASGEVFNSSLYTAAHPSLPFGTILTVTNQHNGRRVNVRVNDRGPFVSARIIDVSRAAAEQLDMLVTGTAPVLVEGAVNSGGGNPYAADQSPYSAGTNAAAISGGGWSNATSQVIATIPPSPQDTVVIQQYQPPQQPQPIQAPPPVQQVQQYQPVQQQAAPVQQYQPLPPQIIHIPQAPQPVQPPPVQIITAEAPVLAVAKPAPEPRSITVPAVIPNKIYRIQVGSFKVARNAVEAYEKLKNAGLAPVYERNGEYFRVVLSGIRSEDVESVARKIGAAGFGQPLFRMEN
ncbi:MAG: septal ring lytic transglycosylase RlpA family protein [Treponema sp.]|jgi:rare lipoprotein A|nr:septal ring lytic transglycosylase RlpA family protein [Treponema sp.]